MKYKKEVSRDTKRKNMTFFMLIYPSVLLAIIPEQINGNPFYSLVLKIMILMFQYFIAKNFIESVYD